MKRQNAILEQATDACLRVALAICSVGRPQQLFDTLTWLTRQTKRPSHVVIVVTAPCDLPDELNVINGLPMEIVFSPKGLTRQRNRALDVLTGRCDVIFYIDDDYLAASSAVQEINKAFCHMQDVTGITGLLLADGINCGGIDAAYARSLITDFEVSASGKSAIVTDRGRRGLYGCNMAFRMTAVQEIRFDENLPLYGWQEDVDFSNRVDGKSILLGSLVGVHCGTPSGRETNGTTLGYSQIANPLYLLRKGTLSWHHAVRLILGNMTANLLGMAHDNKCNNRSDRFFGNLVALFDLVIGRIHPSRIENLTPN